MTWHTLVESVGDVWLIWLATTMCLSIGVYRGLSRLRRGSLRRFWADEEGASYALPYVLTFPIYMLLVCLMIQASLILLVKFGNAYAAYAAARAAIVWRPSDPEDDEVGLENARFRAGRAAILATAPFASGYPEHRQGLYPLFPFRLDWDNPLPLYAATSFVPDSYFYERIYRRLARYNGQASRGYTSRIIRRPNALAKRTYVRNKYLYAAAASKVHFPDEAKAWNQELEVKVTYRMPMHIPGAGRILGVWWRRFYARDISTTIRLPSEAPQTDTGRLTIPYDPAILSRYFDS